MLLSCRMLANVADVNNFRYDTQIRFTEGDAPTVYFQLIDAGKDRIEDGFNPSGRRYCPASGTTLSILVDTLDDAKKITRVCTQPFAQDPSIWALVFMSTDTIRGTTVLRITMTEPGPKVTKGSSQIGAVLIDSAGSQ